MALGKIGQAYPEFPTLPILQKHLVTFNQEVRETAALAMGISQMPAAVEPLRHLVLDDAPGRKLVQKSCVDDRTRSFAAYGMGLIAYATHDVKIKTTTLETMAKILRSDTIADRNVRVAALHALGLLNPRMDRHGGILDRALDELDAFYDRKLGRGEQLIQAHVPTSVVKLLGRGNEGRRARYKDLYARELVRARKRALHIQRSAAIALGQLALAEENDKRDARYSAVLMEYFRHGRDQQTRYFALMSLGQIGGVSNRNRLLNVLHTGKKALERPWAALALGVMCHHALAAGDATDTTVGDALLTQFREVRTPGARGAFAIALGLARYRDAATTLLEELVDKKHQERLAGHVAIGLALMDYRKARPVIQDICRQATARPQLLQQSALALGKLGDRTVTKMLMQMLRQKSANLATLSSISVALGFVGDRRSVTPLVNLLAHDRATSLSRAFAAAALGGIADKEKLPWNAKIAGNSNYRAAVETLLDIL